MINQSNISAYIQHLYWHKNKQQAPQTLIDNWSSLSNSEIQENLKKLYEHWGYTSRESSTVEQDFFNLQFKKTSTDNNIKQNNTKQTVSSQAPAKKTNWLLPLVIIALGAGLYFLYAINKQKNEAVEQAKKIAEQATQMAAQANQSAEEAKKRATEMANNVQNIVSNTPTDNSENLSTTEVVPAQAEDATATATIESSSVRDENNMEKLKRLFTAEEQKDFNGIWNIMSNNMVKYWDIKNPTKSELEKKYYDNWNKITNISYSNLAINKIGYNEYVVTGTFNFYSYTDAITKAVPMKTYYRFDEDGYIDYTNKAKD